MTKFILIFYACLFTAHFGFCQNKRYYDNLKKNKKNTIAYSKEMLKSLESSTKNQLDKVFIIKEQIRKQREILQIINKEILLIDEEIKVDEDRLSELNRNFENVKKEYARLIYFSSLNMSVQRRMIYILSADNFNKAYKRIIYLKQLSDYRKSRSRQIEQSIKLIDSTVLTLKQLKNEKQSLMGEKSAEIDSLSVITKELNRIISSTKSKITEVNSQFTTEQTKNTVIKQKVSKEISTQEENTEIVVSKKSHKLDGNISKKFLDKKRWHIWPLEKYVVLHHYGDYYHPELQNIIVKNDGIELGSSPGKHVHCIFEGVVIRIIPIPGDGTSLIIRHGDYYSVYSKVENVSVSTGDIVSKGQVIAKLGSGGKVVKMSFQLWHKKEKLNPELWLKRQ